MSGSITIIGGHTGSALTGLVTTPVDLTASVTSALQTLLSATAPGLSDSVLAGQAFLNNINVVNSGIGPVGANTSGLPGLLELTNTYSNGSVVGGSVSGSTAVPSNYSTLIVQAPGTETISGNGSSNFLALFGAQSSVNFNTGGGSGTVAAGGGGDFVLATGVWTVVGSTAGNDSIAANGANTYISTYGQGLATNNAIGADSTPSNVVGLIGANAVIDSNGTNDLIDAYNGNGTISVNGSANVLVSGGQDTVYATSTAGAVNAFFQIGGKLDFINNSTGAETVSGDAPGASGGSATVFGGSGGGVYIGGSAGNNSLVGGSGLATLVGAGTNNFLSVSGAGSVNAANLLIAGDGGATMVAGASTDVNQFFGGTGTDSIVSFGNGQQVYFIGASGSEKYTGTTVSGAQNEYIFNPASGIRQDQITNFRLGSDLLTVSGGTITSVNAAGNGSLVTLSDNTVIQLLNVSATSIASVVGGSSIV